MRITYPEEILRERIKTLEAENEQWKVDCNELLLEVAKLRSALKNHSYTGKGWQSFKETYEALRASEWQGMDSAPRDATRILAWATRKGWEDTSGALVVCAWHGHRWAIMGAIDNASFPDTKDECTPTHWRPLPAPPATETPHAE